MPCSSLAISFTSAPVLKARPMPLLTMTHTSGSRSSSSQASPVSSISLPLIAFRDFGRLKISQPTRPRFSTMMVS